MLGYRVTVCDARPVFATRLRFPDADEVVVDWPDRLLAASAGRSGPATRGVLTHDAKFDAPASRGAGHRRRLHRGAGQPAHPRRAAVPAEGGRRRRRRRWPGCGRRSGSTSAPAPPRRRRCHLRRDRRRPDRHQRARLTDTDGPIHRRGDARAAAPEPLRSGSARIQGETTRVSTAHLGAQQATGAFRHEAFLYCRLDEFMAVALSFIQGGLGRGPDPRRPDRGEARHAALRAAATTTSSCSSPTSPGSAATRPASCRCGRASSSSTVRAHRLLRGIGEPIGPRAPAPSWSSASGTRR